MNFDITAIGVKIFNLVQYLMMTITNMVKKARGEETVYSPEDIEKVAP